MSLRRRVGSSGMQPGAKACALVLLVAATATAAEERPALAVRGDAATTSQGQVVAEPFEVPDSSPELYGIVEPSGNPDLQVKRLGIDDDGDGYDDVELYLETWLPAAKDGNVPPDKLPTVLRATAYDFAGQGARSRELLEPLVRRGYAYSRLHVRGSGSSSGCLLNKNVRAAKDVARAIEYLGAETEWSNGRVGLSGLSWEGGAALNAALRGGAEQTRYVQAIEVAAPDLSWYEGLATHDGVPHSVNGQSAMPNVIEYGLERAVLGEWYDPRLAERTTCLPDHTVASVEILEGSKTRYFEDRDMRSAVHELDTPLLLFHGHLDYAHYGVLPIVQAGFFDRLPDGVPHVGIFGLWDHEYPVNADGPASDVRLDVRRADAQRLRIAWFDHFLRDIDVDAEDWPQVQVQTTDGLWRVLDRWPTPDGNAGQLALGPDGQLGATDPDGVTVYLEGGAELKAVTAPATEAVFVTPPLAERLELSGIAVADLWVQLQVPDAHVVVTLEALDADGATIDGARTYGSRSAQHLDPIENGRFTQSKPQPPKVGEPVNVRVRLNPTALVVPEGGQLRMTVSGTANTAEGLGTLTEEYKVGDPVLGHPTQPSGVTQVVAILHDCRHPSMLRFTLPDRDRFITVPQLDPDDPEMVNAPSRDRMDRPAVDGGGAATAPVCGAPPTNDP